MYGKLFTSMYDGTLAENWKALVTFQQMIILCDPDGIVDMTPTAISRRTGIPQDIIAEGVTILEQPDQSSRTMKDSGKRIIRIDTHRSWGWQIVNHEKYKKLRTADDRREYMKLYMREQRAKAKDVNNESLQKFTEVNSKQPLAQLAHAEAYVDTEVKDKKITCKTLHEIPSNSPELLEETFYLTKKNRKLKGKKLEDFKKLYSEFKYKKGRPAAADSFLDIKDYSREMLEKTILPAARAEAISREKIIANGGTPKMLQGWITARRWEDEDMETEMNNYNTRPAPQESTHVKGQRKASFDPDFLNREKNG